MGMYVKRKEKKKSYIMTITRAYSTRIVLRDYINMCYIHKIFDNTNSIGHKDIGPMTFPPIGEGQTITIRPLNHR